MFERPLYLTVLTGFLVVLVTAAAAHAVFPRPLDPLIININAGALVLGVWGVRSILLGSDLPGMTVVDLALAVVILVLLATISARTLWLPEEGTQLRLLRRTRATGEGAATPAPLGGDDAATGVRAGARATRAPQRRGVHAGLPAPAPVTDVPRRSRTGDNPSATREHADSLLAQTPMPLAARCAAPTHRHLCVRSELATRRVPPALPMPGRRRWPRGHQAASHRRRCSSSC